MKFQKFKSFWAKPTPQKIGALRFFARHALARIRYLPLTLYFRVTPNERIDFGWSYLPACFEEERGIFDRECLGVDSGELRFLWRVLRPGMTFLDVGAFHGIYSIVAAQRVGSKGRVVAFEPSSRERRVLKYHAFLNRSLPITIEPHAVGATTGAGEFFIVSDGLEMMNSLRRPNVDSELASVQVSTISLDDYCQSAALTHVDCMKLDVEGGEIEVLNGARQLLANSRPIIICEVLDWVAKPWGRQARDTVIYLQNLEYSWFDFTESGDLRPHKVMDYYPDHVRNFLAVPNEKVADLAISSGSRTPINGVDLSPSFV